MLLFGLYWLYFYDLSDINIFFKRHCVDKTLKNPLKSDVTTVFTIRFKCIELDSLVKLLATEVCYLHYVVLSFSLLRVSLQ